MGRQEPCGVGVPAYRKPASMNAPPHGPTIEQAQPCYRNNKAATNAASIGL